MRRRLSTFLSAAIVVCAARSAHGQACCAGTGAVSPARLAPHEDALAGLQVRGSGSFGSFSSTGAWVPAPANVHEHHFEQNLFAAARLFTHTQVAALVPVVQTRRDIQGSSEFGGGLGDIAVTGRHDFLYAHGGNWLGVAGLASIVAPTGTSVDLANRPLATDSTGMGVFQGSLGLALEHLAGHWLFNLNTIVTGMTPRTVMGVTEVLSPRFTTLLATTYVFQSGAAIAMLVSYAVEGDAWVDGKSVARSGRRDPQLMIASVYPIDERWRLQANVFAHAPIPVVGQNVLANAGAGVTLTRSWW